MSGSNAGSACQRCERKNLDCDWSSWPDQRRNRTDTKAHVQKLEAELEAFRARIGQLEAQLATATLARRPASPVEVSPSASTALSPVTTGATLHAPATVESLAPDADGELRLFTGTSSFRGRPVEPPAASSPANYTFLPIPLSTALHAEILDLALTWHFGAWRTIEREDFINNIFSGTRGRHYSPFLHLAVLAIGCRYLQNPLPSLCSDPSDPSTRGEPFLNAAVELLPAEIATPKFSTLRGLMAIGHYLGGNGRPHAGWIYFGICCRMACDFGLTINPPAGSLINEDLRHSRTKLFWDVFIHDVAWSLFIGRSTYFPLANVRQPFPLALDAKSSNSFTSPTASTSTDNSRASEPSLWDLELSLSVLGSSVLKLNYTDTTRDPVIGKDASVRKLYGELEKWYQTRLPENEKRDAIVIKLPALMQLHFNYAGFAHSLFHERLLTSSCLQYLLLILLFRPYLSPRALPETVTLAETTVAHAASRVVEIMRLFEAENAGMEEDKKLRFSAHVYQVLFHAGAASLELASCLSATLTSSTPSSPPLPSASSRFTRLLSHADFCIAALLPQAQVWTSAARCASVLSELRAAAVQEWEDRPSTTLAGRVDRLGPGAARLPQPEPPAPLSSSSLPTLSSATLLPGPPFLVPGASSAPPARHPASSIISDTDLLPAVPSAAHASYFPLPFGGFAGVAASGADGFEVGGGAGGSAGGVQGWESWGTSRAGDGGTQS
ncbi:hypothetical protein JCM8097_008048 [Rhodosporidiobolus ruineniae]